MRPLLIISVTILCICNVVIAQYAQPGKSAAPAWVTHTKVDYAANKLDKEAEDGYIDLCFEKQVSLGDESEYYRTVVKIISQSGIENVSEISVNYDPSYSKVTFHTINVIREGKVINKLAKAKFRVLPVETALDRHLYNGTLSAMLILDDIRKDDIIEYSYTVKGFNPVFKGRYCEKLLASFSYPFYNVYYKLISPKQKTFKIVNTLTKLQPEITLTASEIIYEWKIKDVEPVRLQDKLPSWYDPYNWIMISEYKSWGEVAKWVSELFPQHVKLSAALRNKVAAINERNPTTESKVLEALRFVQDEIRYTGIEMGVHSHKPHDPNKVFQQRFGDCKDKSYLLCTMLKEMNIEAYPVFTNTWAKSEILNSLPSHFAFDHATAVVNVNGKMYWFDPTLSHQKGSIETISYPDYQYGLVISPAADRLTRIHQEEKGEVKVKELFNIKNMAGEATMEVVSVYSGSFADNMRSSFSSSSLSEQRKQFKNFYSYYFENIEIDSLRISDDDASGIFTMYEYYTIPGIWKKDGDRDKVVFEPFVINNLLYKPRDVKRHMPIGITFPAKYTEEIEVSLPEAWRVEDWNNKFNSGAYKISYDFYDVTSRKVRMYYEYEALRDYIDVEEAKRYFEDRQTMDNEMAFEIFKASDGSPGVPGLTASLKEVNSSATNFKIIFSIALVGGLLFIAWRMRG